MGEYRAQIRVADGHIQLAVELDCDDEEAAIVRAKQLNEQHDGELWKCDRLIKVLEARNK
jgi:hypothetical protein